MTNIFNWFKAIDKRLWGCEIESNGYLPSLVLPLIFISGILAGLTGNGTITTEIETVSVAALGVCISGFLIGESICLARKPSVALQRAVLLVASMAATLTAGLLIADIG